MDLKRKWAMIAGSVLVSSAVVTGAAFAASNSSGSTTTPAAPEAKAQGNADRLNQAVTTGKLTQAEADLLKQIGDLRQTAMAKVKADSQALVDQAVKDGKITQAQADKLKTERGRGFGGEHEGDRQGDHGKGGPGHKALTQEELKAKLDAEVKAGKLTQEKADQMLQKFADRAASKAKSN